MTELEVIRQAILNEDEGAAFYYMAAAKTDDEVLKEAYTHLKDEELKHGSWLRSLYERISKQEDSSNLEWKTLGDVKGQSPRLFAQADTKFKMAITDMAVFSAGALMEEASIEFYKKASAETKSAKAKELYDILIKWENDHLHQLKIIHEALMKDWLDQYEFTHSPKL